uniref:N-terminal E2 ubiquitin-conjugating enzyme n=1 Tax=Dromaius novaehollandiae TaxID=8790 RepID=A0A8C4JTW9_DRONO
MRGPVAMQPPGGGGLEARGGRGEPSPRRDLGAPGRCLLLGRWRFPVSGGQVARRGGVASPVHREDGVEGCGQQLHLPRVTEVTALLILLEHRKRLQKELLALQNDPPPGMTLNEKSVQNSITQWIVDMEGAPGTLYEGEKFQLLFKFSSRYPFDSPQVMFTGDNIPVHPHVYSNGHICLSILTEDWSPALSVQSVCLSIISMLSSCKEKRRPPDNSFYVRTCNKNPKKTKWWYHDDTC